MAKLSPPERLRRWRGKLSYRHVARTLGCAASTLMRIEHGYALPGMMLAERIEAHGGGSAKEWHALRVAAARESAMRAAANTDGEHDA